MVEFTDPRQRDHLAAAAGITNYTAGKRKHATAATARAGDIGARAGERRM
jgi:hypothetical protein